MAMLMLSAAMVSVMLSRDVVSPLDSLSSRLSSRPRCVDETMWLLRQLVRGPTGSPAVWLMVRGFQGLPPNEVSLRVTVMMMMTMETVTALTALYAALFTVYAPSLTSYVLMMRALMSTGIMMCADCYCCELPTTLWPGRPP